MGAVARKRCGCSIVTGDTKVVRPRQRRRSVTSPPRASAATAGVGLSGAKYAPATRCCCPDRRSALHGIAVLSVRDGLEFGADLRRTPPLTPMTQALLGAGVAVSMMRDPTRGGVAATLNEIAHASGTGVEIIERDVPMPDAVRARPVASSAWIRCTSPTRARRWCSCAARNTTGRWGTGSPAMPPDRRGHGRAPRGGSRRTGIGGTRVVDLPLAKASPAC